MSKSLRTLKVVIPDGNPLNYKQVVGGSDCVMHVLSRSFCISENLNELKGMQRPALYLLIDEKGKGYIGQTKGFAARVKDHLAKKPWWTRLRFRLGFRAVQHGQCRVFGVHRHSRGAGKCIV